MYRNKKDVDKHVESLMYKLSSKDFTTRAYSIARLYYEVGDYGSCQKYVEQYLTQKSNNAAAHKLLGQAFQKLGEKEKALEQYKTSFDIDPTQTSTILDVCELLADDEVDIDPGRAKFWCEKAEANFPKHPVTFRLREKLLSVADPDPDALVKLIKSELEVRPNDAVLHARLLKHYLHHSKYMEAFDHSCNIELDKKLFPNNFAWYETLSEILKYSPLKINDWMYQLLLLTVRERICVLSLTEVPNASTRSLLECNDHIHAYDQAVETVSKSGSPPGFGEFHTSLLKHHQGQLVFHAATYLLKKAKKDQLNWRDAKKISAPLMLLAWQTIPLDLKVNWLTHAPERHQNAVRRWYIEGSFRCSQAGHYLQSIAQDKSQILLDQISQFCSGTNWKDKLYEKIFSAPEQLAKIKSSYLASNVFSILALRLPRTVEIQAYDNNAQREYPNSLHHFVWILLNYKNYADFKCTLFDMLTSTTTSSGPETLNKTDILAFLYSSALTAQKLKNKVNYMSIEKPILPANITDLLCSLPQMKWWDCAYKLSQNELGVEYTDIRSTLSRGIEVIRCIDNHGLDPELLTILGRIFSKLAKASSKIEEKSNFEQRSYLYYSSAIPLLEKLKNKLDIKLPEKRLFDYVHDDLETKEINNLLEESKIYVALCHLNDSEYEKAINLLSNLKSPEAYYHLSHTYKIIALNEKKAGKSIDSEKKCLLLLEKSKNFAYKALDVIRDVEISSNKTLYDDIQALIEEIELHINKIDPDVSIAMNDNLSDDTVSFNEIGSLRFKTNIFRNTSSTPKHVTKHQYNVNTTAYRTATDSQIFENTQADQLFLERIEKQIKNLQKRDSSINDFMEQTRDWFEENRKLGTQIISTINSNIENTTEQFKLLKISVDQVKEQIDECRKECKDVVELKKQISDLKKEVNKLKKTSSEQTIDESDLYNLDEEYRTNENTTTFGTHLPFTTPSVIPPYAQRFMPPFSVPSNPYQLYGQNFYNLYNQYSQFAQSSVPGAPPIFDPTRTQINFPGVYPTPDQMYLDAAHLVPTTLPAVPAVVPAPVVHNVPSAPPVSVAPPPVIPTSKIVLDTKESSKSSNQPSSLPVNVVITSSDPLPTGTITQAPVLSVTIPQKHIKGSPHNYQIQMPTSNDQKTVAPPIFHFPLPGNKTIVTSSSTSNWNAKSIFSTTRPENILPTKSSTDTFKDLDNSKNVVDGVFSGLSPNTSLNKSRTLSEKSNTSIENYDPCPDFKPIIPLPAEVKVTTGEEDELVIFSARAKLFRFTDKQWKERGIGEMKLLKHKVTGKVRVLMRREQVHKICANHIILPEMEIKPMKNETKAYFWVANDFAEETVILEKFCIRFKTADIAKDFFDTFENARKESCNQSSNAVDNKKIEGKAEEDGYSSTSAKDNSALNNQAEKTVVGGFTFNSKPSFKSVENIITETKTTDLATTKINVFSGLTFKTTTSTPFASILNVSNNGSINAKPTQEKISSTTSKLNNSDLVEEFEPTTEFKPVIPLPALIDQKTGEEDETVLFEHRAKLLRFDVTGKEWKERGLGNIKLLVRNDNNQKIRLLMRREQIMKVCCNHAVTKEMVFQKMPNMDKAVTWCAKDFSEGELVSETFCLRFKTVQTCDDFINAVKSAQAKIGDQSKVTKEEQNVSKHSSVGFGDKFKPKPGAWTCETCYTNNLETFVKCPCCETPKPQDANTNPNITSSNVSDWGAQFKPKPGSWECKECLIRNEADKEYCNACNSPKDPNMKKDVKPLLDNVPKFNFGIPSNKSSNSQINLSTSEPKFSFGIPQNIGVTKTEQIVATSNINTNASPKFSFGITQIKPVTSGVSVTTPEIKPSIPQIDSAAPINFSLKNKEEECIKTTPVKPALLPTPNVNMTSFGNKEGKFQFSFKPKTQVKGKSPSKSPKDKKGDDSDDNEYASEDEGHHIHFSPVIPMPDKIEVVTGEENEDELYGHRAKLYIFAKGEWKERGIGIVKILKHKETGKLRVVMRREQVHKICLNYALGPDNIHKPKDEKSWCFVANDFSEGEIMLQNFCIRFQNKEVALQFKDAIDKAIKEKYGIIDRQDIPVNSKDADGDEVIFINEIQATNEEKEKAKELMLPENFYTYKNKDPCQGCRGCDGDDIVKPKSDKDLVKDTKVLPKQDLNTTPLKTSTFNFQSPANSMYGTPNIFDKTVDTTIFRTPLSTNGSNTTASSSTTSNSSFVENNTIDKENTLTEKPQNPIKPVSFVSGSQTQNMSSVLAAPKLVSVTTSVDNGAPAVKTAFGFTENKSIFDENKVGVPSNKSIFGFNLQSNKDDSQSGKNKSIFGVDLTSGQLGSQGSIFGMAASKTNTTSGIFGSTGTFTFGNVTQPSESSTTIFGKASAENASIFSDKVDISSNKPMDLKTSIDSTEKFTFGKNVILQNQENGKPFGISLTVEKPETVDNTVSIIKNTSTDVKSAQETKESIPLKVDNALTFAALSSTGPGFGIQKNSDFKWEGAGQQLFVSKTREVDDKSKTSVCGDANNSGTGAAVEEEYDPYYEPIVPLPDKIVVTTGEEDEEKIFGERCKLYRYDEKSREWKERGVGEMKVLYHPQKNSYRLLLRREQVHKAVLNMLVFKDLELLPMKNSDRAWTWYGNNYAESAGEQETLAVRFKSVALATAFQEKVMECVRKLQVAAAQANRKENEAKEKHVDSVTPKELQAETVTQDPETPSSESKHGIETSQDNKSKSGLEQKLEGSETHKSSVTEVTKQVHFEKEEEQGEYDEDYEHGYDQNEDYYYNEEEESSLYYPCKALVKAENSQTTCDTTCVQVSFDQEICSPKILVTDSNSGEILADMLIHTDTEFQLSGDTCTWTGMDYTSNQSVEKTLTITFADSDAAMEFYDSCETSKAATYASTDSES